MTIEELAFDLRKSIHEGQSLPPMHLWEEKIRTRYTALARRVFELLPRLSSGCDPLMVVRKEITLVSRALQAFPLNTLIDIDPSTEVQEETLLERELAVLLQKRRVLMSATDHSERNSDDDDE